MARIKCPQKCTKGYHYSWGDGWEEWDECRCCNPKGENDSGMTTKRRVAKYEAECAAEEKRIDAQISQWEREPCSSCGAANANCRCGDLQNTASA